MAKNDNSAAMENRKEPELTDDVKDGSLWSNIIFMIKISCLIILFILYKHFKMAWNWDSSGVIMQNATK